MACIQCCKSIDLARVRYAHNHSELLVHGWVRRSRFHAAKFNRRPPILVQVGKNSRGFHRLCGKHNRCRCAHGATYVFYRGAIFGDQHAAYAIEGSHPGDVTLDDLQASRLARFDGLVKIVGTSPVIASARQGPCLAECAVS